MKKSKTALHSIDAPYYGYWTGFYSSFFKGGFYVDVAKRWRGLGVLYLLFIIALCMIPPAIHSIVDFNRYFEGEIIDPIRLLPSMRIEKGNIILNKPEPYFIRNNKGQVVMVVDTKSHRDWMHDTSYPYITTVFTKNQVLYRTPPSPFMRPDPKTPDTVYKKPIPVTANEIFDGEAWVRLAHLTRVKAFLEVVIYPSLVSFFFAVTCLGLLGFAMLGQIISQTIFKIRLTYPQSARLLLCSTTPAWCIYSVIGAIGEPVLLWKWPILIIAAIYFSFAILSYKREQGGIVRL